MKKRMITIAMMTMLVAGAAMGEDKKPKSTAKPAAKKSTPAKKPSTTKKTTPAKKAEPVSLLEPSKLTAKAPDVFAARFETSKGAFVIEVHREWAPKGADRFYNLVKNGFYDNVRFFRVLSGFMAQFGINGDPKIAAAWDEANIDDDPVVKSNTRGMVSYAMGGPGTRTTQIFINYADRNARLDSMGFAPFGQVIEGMEVVDALYSGYGEGAPGGRGPHQGRIQTEGNQYLNADYPQLDYVKTARIVTK